MPGVGSRLARWRGGVVALTVMLVVTADQLTKNLWVRSFSEGHSFFEFGFGQLIHVRNSGAAFGIFAGRSVALKIIGTVGILTLVAIVLFARRRFPHLISRETTVGAGLIIGGACGNLIDRFRFDQVTDFIDIGIWPAFNVADSAIVIGAIITGLSLLRLTRTEQNRADGSLETPLSDDDAPESPPSDAGTAGVG